jgi:hypothetical protein
LKRIRLLVVLAFTVFSLMLLPSAGWSTNTANAQKGHGSKHGFSVKQYEDFHDVLHPLQHDALPNKNFKEIRARSAQLIRLGRAIVRLGVPRGTSKQNRAEFGRELRKFSKALANYNAGARRGSDAQLEASYSAVHDSFEMLAAMLPRA